MANIIGATRLINSLRHQKSKRKTQAQLSGYKRRNRTLSELGYSSYHEYLKSDDWAKLRQRKLFRYRKCLLCPNRSAQVHHIDYSAETLLGLRPHCLVCLCDGCHRQIEFDGSGEKRRLCDTRKELRRLASQSKLGRRWLLRVARASKKDMARRRKARKRRK